MKKAFISLCAILFGLVSFAQEEQKDYVVESDGSISFSQVIEAKDGKSKDAIFPLIEAYFSYNYNDGKSVIQTTNKEQYYIIGSGIYSQYNKETDNMFGLSMVYSTPHVIRIDCKDGKVRVIITVSKYDIRESNWMDSNKNVKNYSEPIKYTYPFIPAKKEKKLSASEKRYESTFNALKYQIEKSFRSVEDAINVGNSVLENADW